MRLFLAIISTIVFLTALSAHAGEVKMYLRIPGVANTVQPDSESDLAINAQALQAEVPAGPSHVNMAHVEGGCFVMGSPEGEGDANERPPAPGVR